VSEPSPDSETLQAKYAKLLAEPGYNALREAASIIGTWNYNTDGPNSFSREDNKRLFLDFMGEPEASLRRQQDQVYTAYTYGPRNKQVKIILLDTRAQAEPVASKGLAKKKTIEADLLGEAQWEWLEKELKQNPAELTLIGNSTQIIPEEHSFAKWANHPQARERFLKLLARTNSKGVVLLSGERRMAEISQLAVKGWHQPLYEVTSSGLTLSHKNKPVTETNKHRMGTAVAKRNFGLIQIDWTNRQAKLQVQGDRNQTLLSQNISF
jgi:alkaline phosphatase D